MVLLAFEFFILLVNQFKAFVADSTVMIIIKSLCLYVQQLDLNTNDIMSWVFMFILRVIRVYFLCLFQRSFFLWISFRCKFEIPNVKMLMYS